MIKHGLPIVFIGLIAFSPAYADGNNASFDQTDGALTASVLGAISAPAALPPATFGTVQQANIISGDVFRSGVGVIAINQNTGANAISQQTVTVNFANAMNIADALGLLR